MCAGLSRKAFVPPATYDRFLRYVCDSCTDLFDNTRALCEIDATLKQQRDIVGDAMLQFKRLQERMDLRDSHIDELSSSLSAPASCECASRIDTVERKLSLLIRSTQQDLAGLLSEAIASRPPTDSVSKDFLESTLSRHLSEAEHVFSTTFDIRANGINSTIRRSINAFMGIVDQAALYLSTRLDTIEERISFDTPRFAPGMQQEWMSSATDVDSPTSHSPPSHEAESLGDEIGRSDPGFALPGPEPNLTTRQDSESCGNGEPFAVNALAILVEQFGHGITSLYKGNAVDYAPALVAPATEQKRVRPKRRRKKKIPVSSQAQDQESTPPRGAKVGDTQETRDQGFRKAMTRQQMPKLKRKSMRARPPITQREPRQYHRHTKEHKVARPLRSQPRRIVTEGGHSAIRWEFEQETHEKFTKMMDQSLSKHHQPFALRNAMSTRKSLTHRHC